MKDAFQARQFLDVRNRAGGDTKGKPRREYGALPALRQTTDEKNYNDGSGEAAWSFKAKLAFLGPRRPNFRAPANQVRQEDDAFLGR